MTGAYREDMLSKIQTIKDFAYDKANSLYAASITLSERLKRQFLILTCILLLLTILVSGHFVKSIRTPLKEMNGAVLRFQSGDRDARSLYQKENEFGVLSASINAMADTVQENAFVNQNAVCLAEVMLSEDDAKPFFASTLHALAEYTGSQVAAAYLLNDDRTAYELYASIGVGERAKQSFDAQSLEGEIGAAVFTQKTQHIKNIGDDTRFVFPTASGGYIPKELLVIPILSGHNVTAIIALASLHVYKQQALRLADSVLTTMSTRIEGILAQQKIMEFQMELKQQNLELEAQQRELTAQTAELTQQNVELEMQKKQLDEANRLKTNFLSNMSHELRTPLNSVIALTGVLSRRLADRIPKEDHSFLEIIERNGKNLLALINDILDISRIETGHEETEFSAFSVNPFLREVMDMMWPQAEQKGLGFTFDPLEPDLSISSDMDKCRHIIQNLLANAVKFTEKGSVDLSARLCGGNLEIAVADTGIGISQEHLPYIFDEFRQADSSLSRRYGGAGLGLAIAKRYALLLGGDIAVKSAPNEGSVFTVRLPLHTVQPATEDTARAEPGPRRQRVEAGSLQMDSFSGKEALLVEDNEVAVIQVKDLLQEMGIAVRVACGAEEALRLIEEKIPDAMILDLMMPGIDGFHLLEILRNAEPTAHTPVLVLTAKQISKEELGSLKRNSIHQLIRKGDVDRLQLKSAISGLFAGGTEQKAKMEQATPPAHKPAILVTEDDPDNMTTVKALLSERFTILEARDAKECLIQVKAHLPDLVLMDIGLSGMSGIDAFLEIRKDPSLSSIPVIALTASAMEHEKETILAYGFDGFIPKPIIQKTFDTVISEVLYGRKPVQNSCH